MERMLDLAFQLGEHSTPLMVGDYRGLIIYIYIHIHSKYNIMHTYIT